MVEPKTVANLPLDVSIRWAEDQKFLEETRPITQEAGTIAQFAQTEVSLPSSQSQLATLLGLAALHPTWALFERPKGFVAQRRRLFTSQLVTFLGSDEQQDTLVTRIQGASGNDEDQESWQKEKDLLLQLMKLMQTLNKDLIDIVSRCKQYQKG